MPKRRDPKFTTLSDKNISARYLKYAEDINALLTCHIQEQDFVFETNVQSVDGFTLQLNIPSYKISAEDLLKKINNTSARVIDISYKVNDVLLFASCTTKSVSNESLTLEAEHPLYKLQRRDNMRVRPESDIQCEVEIELSSLTKQKKSYRPYDLSIGGFALLLNKNEAMEFKKSRVYTNAKISFDFTEIKLREVKVVSKVRLSNTENVRIGFSMHDIPNSFGQAIMKYAHSHSQRIWGKRISK